MKYKVYFFGNQATGKSSGHFLYDHEGGSYCDNPFSGEKDPWNFGPFGYLDGEYAPKTKSYQEHGAGALVCKEGWTLWQFWDRTGDPRGASNSSFIAQGELTLEELLKLAKEQYPNTFARFVDAKFTWAVENNG